MKIGYMDATDYHHELGEALGGNRIYASEQDLLKHQPCADSCGVVEVEIGLVKDTKAPAEEPKPSKSQLLKYLENQKEWHEQRVAQISVEIQNISITDPS